MHDANGQFVGYGPASDVDATVEPAKRATVLHVRPSYLRFLSRTGGVNTAASSTPNVRIRAQSGQNEDLGGITLQEFLKETAATQRMMDPIPHGPGGGEHGIPATTPGGENRTHPYLVEDLDNDFVQRFLEVPHNSFPGVPAAVEDNRSAVTSKGKEIDQHVMTWEPTPLHGATPQPDESKYFDDAFDHDLGEQNSGIFEASTAPLLQSPPWLKRQANMFTRDFDVNAMPSFSDEELAYMSFEHFRARASQMSMLVDVNGVVGTEPNQETLRTSTDTRPVGPSIQQSQHSEPQTEGEHGEWPQGHHALQGPTMYRHRLEPIPEATHEPVHPTVHAPCWEAGPSNDPGPDTWLDEVIEYEDTRLSSEVPATPPADAQA